MKQRIFEPFFSAESLSKGTGLRLASVYGCIHEHNGCINVESAPGAGSIFALYLPNAEKAEKAAEVLPRTNMQRMRSGIALVVDDKPAMRERS
jgi:K+-sensing histidine kinase KdpD